MEMKYRAFNTETKTWAGWDSFEIGWEYCNNHIVFKPHPKYQKNGWVEMQYSGMKDNNQIEIYKDDIVEVSTIGMNCRNDKIKGVVKIVDGCFTVKFKSPVYDKILKCMRPRLYVKCFTVNKALKVIGNVYDNPDLFMDA